MAFGSYATAAMMRDTIRSVASELLNTERPRYRYAVVDSVNQTTKRAFVKFSGETIAVPVRYGSTIPKPGATVRIGGLTGDRHIEDVVLGDFEIIGGGPPAGSMMSYGGSDEPEGWLLCDGRAVSRTTYSDLFTAIGTDHGAGDGSTTFNLPDARNRFLVGAGLSYPVAAVGGANTVTLTAAQMPNHSHDSGNLAGGNHTHASGNLATGGDNHSHNTGGDNHSHNLAGAATEGGSGNVNWGNVANQGGMSKIISTSASGTSGYNHSHNVSSYNHSHTVAGNSSNSAVNVAGNTGTAGSGSSHENRPPYLAENVIIKT